MDTEEVKSGISLLEEVLESDILNINKRKLKSEQIINAAQKKQNVKLQFGGSLADIPTEIFVVYKTDSVNSQNSNVHYNLAYPNKTTEKCAESDSERIISMRVKHKK